MGSIGTKIQMAIHTHYDNIKLILQFVIIGLIVLVMINANVISERQATQNRESTAEVVDRIDEETKRQSAQIEEQTRKLNQQFQALCFIMVKIAGEDALRNIDPPLEEQCRALTQELRNDETQQTLPQRQSNTSQVPTAPPATPTEPRDNAQTPSNPPTNSGGGGTPPPQNNQSWLLNGVDTLLNGLGL